MPPISLHPLYRGDDESRLRAFAIDADLVARLHASYAALRAQGTALADLFYRRLFEARPDLRAMFRNDPRVQAEKFMASLDTISAFLDDPIAQRAYLRDLGALHATLGVREAHYDLVIEVLAGAMAELLTHAGRHDPEALADWRLALRLISDQMLAGH